MKRMIWLTVCSILLLSLLPGCDVFDAMKITPAPSATATAAVPSKTPNSTPALKREAVAFQDPEVEKTIRSTLGKPEDNITTVDMLRVTSFEYNINRNASGAITTLDDLRWCKNLETLYVLYQQGVTSIESLRELDRLLTVNISGCSVSDLSPLAGKEYLREIGINDTPVTDASSVLSLPSLEVFYASFGTGISDISALSSTHSLKYFSCQRRLNDYTPLLGHKDLDGVSLTGITDEFFRELLANCRHLTNIQIISSDIKDERLSLLKDFNLYSLWLDNCGIKDISALASLSTVQDLLLINNHITDITPLGKLTQPIHMLDIQHNSIKDLSPLENLKNLQNLNVTGNPYTDASVLNKLEQGGCKVYR